YEDLQFDDPPESGIPVGPEIVTTDWIDVSSIDKMKHAFAMTFDGTSVRSRIQWRRDSMDTPKFLFEQSWDRSSYRVFRLPRDTGEFRVYYTGVDTTSADNNVDIRALSE